MKGRTKRPAYRELPPAIRHRLVLTETSLLGLRDCIAPEISRRHEGVAYLYGLTDGTTTLVVGAARPTARTTPGSFEVSAVAMAEVVRAINTAGLQLVGQAHSHPEMAFHSHGDDEGARMAYDGFASIVVPDYGRHLPSLAEAATYFFQEGRFIQLEPEAISIVPGRLL